MAPRVRGQKMMKRNNNSRRRTKDQGDAVGEYFGDAWSLAKRTALGLNEIRKLINVEHKYFDVNTTVTGSQTGFVAPLSLIPQGDNVSERDGDSVKIQSFEMNGSVFRNPAATANEAFRILVVRDLQNPGSTPPASDILETVGSVNAPYQYVDYINGPDMNKRFTIIYDELTYTDTYHPVKQFSFKTNHDCHTYFRGAAGATASMGNGTYFIVVLSDLATSPSTFYFSSRLRFTDN